MIGFNYLIILFALQYCRKLWTAIKDAHDKKKWVVLASLDVKWLISQSCHGLDHGIDAILEEGKGKGKATGGQKTVRIPVNPVPFEVHPLYVSQIALFLLL